VRDRPAQAAGAPDRGRGPERVGDQRGAHVVSDRPARRRFERRSNTVAR
jgi:hypothetical protein